MSQLFTHEFYPFHEIELQAQTYWTTEQTFHIDTKNAASSPYYCLSMLPYPSGELHMGHVRCYTIGDVIARYQRMCGKTVLQPMGWDAFGLPAENAAIEKKIPPAQWTYANIDRMRAQLKRLGLAYDWTKEITTCRPEYYRWEQWFFLKLYEQGLAYKKKAWVNWDPVDHTVLANEQVVDGRGWRSGAPIERKEINQWFLKITHYADDLLDGLDRLTGWPEPVRHMQRNWIGRSLGAEITFNVKDHDPITVFTTRPDTLMGATLLAVAPQHPIATKAANDDSTLMDFIQSCAQGKVAEEALATQEKRGCATGLHAIHPITQKPIPIWVANFVLMDYGHGAVMSVPAHDERDHEFARTYQLPIQPVIQPEGKDWDYQQAAMTSPGTLINSGPWDQLDNEAAKEVIIDHLVKLKAGKKTQQYRLRDWGVSRQRYWGTPIPMIECPDCGTVPVPEQDLPVVLPEEVTFHQQGHSPLPNMPSFVDVPCPQCGADAKRETDTLDTFINSSWYFLRYLSPDCDTGMIDEAANTWLPVNQYIGGIEHAIMHLLYARFFYRACRDLKIVNNDEPFTHLLTQGMVLYEGGKMSKSKGNVVPPQPLIEQYGCDTLRLFTMFAAPADQDLEWSPSGVEGAHRFLKRLWHFAKEHYLAIVGQNKHPQSDTKAATHADHQRQMHLILKQINDDMARQHFNTVVSGIMKLYNLMADLEPSDDHFAPMAHESLNILLRCLNPITPHFCHGLWQALGFPGNIHDQTWPEVDQSALASGKDEYVVQINSKKRCMISLPSQATQEDIMAQALSHERVKQALQGKSPKKTIVVPKKLINIVL